MSGTHRWFIAGASGLLGVRLAGHLLRSGREVIAHHNRHPLPAGLDRFGFRWDLAADESWKQAIADLAPDVVVNCVGLTNVDQCETERDRAERLNSTLAGDIAAVSRSLGAHFVQISTDHLWTGEQAMVDETVPPDPINVYAETKAGGEREVQEADPDALIVRTNFFGPSLSWRQSFNAWLYEQLTQGHSVNAFTDVHFSPIASDLLSALIVELVDVGATGILHVAGSDRISKYDFAVRYAERAGFDTGLVRAGSVRNANLTAPRPKDMSLDCSKAAKRLGRPLPSFEDSLDALLGATQDAPTIPQRDTSFR